MTKKLISLVVSLVLCLNLVGCSKQAEPEAETEPTNNVIELNNENIEQYLNIRVGEPEYDDWYYDCELEFYPLQGGSFSNVEIVFLTELWEGRHFEVVGAEVVNEQDYAAEGQYYFTDNVALKFKLPADGRYVIDLHYYSTEDVEPLEYVSVSGTFTPLN